jgi:16S rRNA (cytidine1402-2'-O)-methyltransferase
MFLSQVTENTLGCIFVVATPIGNRKDITIRALEILQGVDGIAAEDVRHSRLLLAHYGIDKKMFSLHDHNEKSQSEIIIRAVLAGENWALISDAGTPLLNDPGFSLVQQAHAYGIPVQAIPGACSPIAALSVAALPCDRFFYLGFLPAKAGTRENFLQRYQNIDSTLVTLVTPHRLMADLQAVAKVFGEQQEIALAHELTKQYEYLAKGSVVEIIAWLTAEPLRQKGEFVLLIAPRQAAREEFLVSEAQVLQTLLKALPLKQAVALAAELLPVKKNLLYQQALHWQARAGIVSTDSNLPPAAAE